ncbi:MAG TPA: hypothetical protein VIM48_04705 [Chthoniobacterales bacterium]
MLRLVASILIGAAGACLAQAFTIPLYHVRDEQGNLRLGVYAALGGSRDARLYELDTGSSGMYAAYNAAWWPQLAVVRPSPGPQDYGSGVQFDADIVKTQIAFRLGDGSFSMPATVEIGRIQSGAAKGISSSRWASMVARGQPPLHGVFFGNMGSGLKEKNGLFAVLAQIPGATNGFIIRSGGVVEQLGRGQSIRRGEVVVGLTPASRAQFPVRVPMLPQIVDGSPLQLPSGYAARDEYPLAVQITLTGPDGNTASAKARAVLDTGGVNIHIHPGSGMDVDLEIPRSFLVKDKRLRPDTNVEITAPGGWNWNFTAGTTKSVNRMQVTPAGDQKAGGINLGISVFFDFDVMFDIENGVIGFRPITSGSSGEAVGNQALQSREPRANDRRETRRDRRRVRRELEQGGGWQ